MKRAKQRKFRLPVFFMLITPFPWQEIGELRPIGEVPLIRGEIGNIDCGFRLVESPRGRP